MSLLRFCLKERTLPSPDWARTSFTSCYEMLSRESRLNHESLARDLSRRRLLVTQTDWPTASRTATITTIKTLELNELP
jgi:hypothetical protein